MPLNAFKNLAYSTVAAAPSPAASGTSLDVAAGEGSYFPATPFNATIWPASSIPTPTNAEIVTVTNVATDTLTLTRAQEGTSARTVLVGDQIAATVTAKTLSTLESDISAVSAAVTSVDTHAATASAAATSVDAHAAAASAAATSVDTRVNTVSNLVSALTSAHNALSNIVSDSLSIGNVASNVLSALAVSVESLSTKVVSVSAQLTSVEAHAAAASAAATSADAHAAAASAAATSVDAHATAASAAATSVDNRLNIVSTVSAGGTAVGLQSVVNALSTRIAAIPGGASTPPVRVLSAIASVDAVALTVVSGYSVSVSAGVTYQLDVRAIMNRITTQTTGFGILYPALAGSGTNGGGRVYAHFSATTSIGAAGIAYGTFRGDGGSNSVIMSVSVGGTASCVLFMEGILQMSAGGKVALLMQASTGKATVVLPGSYLQLKRI